MNDPKAIAANQAEPLRHKVVVGVSGRRMGCRVCRVGNLLADGSDNPKWKQPCKPSPAALAQFEQVARSRITDALDDLAHAAAVRRELKGGNHG